MPKNTGVFQLAGDPSFQTALPKHETSTEKGTVAAPVIGLISDYRL